MQSSALSRILSPRSRPGPVVLSIAAHLLIYGSVAGIMGLNLSSAPPQEEYLDLGYQTFDEPPPQQEEVRKVVKSPAPVAQPVKESVPDNSPKEMQDEESEVAGTQKAAPETNLGSENEGSAHAAPYYKIKPKYPKAALLAGLEGWVLFLIDVTEAGDVENIRVVDGEQRETFASEARRAVAKFKYRPFTDATGQPVRKSDHQVRIDFKLTDTESASL